MGLGFGEVIHVGRRSGRTYRTPVRAVRHDDTVIVGANFGVQADWIRNLIAAGSARIRIGADELTVTRPRVVEFGTVRALLPPVTRFILTSLSRTEQCVVVSVR